MAVGEYRCLPEQSTFTIEDSAVNAPRRNSAFFQLGYAEHDLSVTERSCDGWYWSVLPAIFVGISVRFAAFGAMHAFQRAQQTKKPLFQVMQKDTRVVLMVATYALIFSGLLVFTTWTMLRTVHHA